MEVNGHVILDDTQDILIELKRQLEINGISRFNKIIVSGQNLQTNCPFHKEGQERKPSFGIHTKTGECHCFGCGWSGTFSEMVSNCFGKDDLGIFGNKWLIKNFITLSVEERPDVDLDFNRHNNTRYDKYKDISQKTEFITEEELDSYRYTHPYMYERKLNNEVIELFDIGYDKNTNCITFPIRNIHGQTLFIARRSVNSKFFNYPQSVEKPVYGLYELNATKNVNGNPVHILPNFPKDIIICESMIDCLTCWVYGKYAVALNGLGNDLQFKQLNNMPCRKFILATDMDEAGQNARKRIKANLKNKLVTEYVWDVSVAKDINDMSYEYFNNLKEVF